MEAIMRFVIKGARFPVFLTAALGLATPALAQAPDTAAAESQEPGSVIVFPKFARGTVTVDDLTTAQTEITIAARCPPDATCREQHDTNNRWPRLLQEAPEFAHRRAGHQSAFQVRKSARSNPIDG